ncbi:MAG: glycoside hydrolase family 6 protein [Nocardioidaceae bacterium]
MTHRTGSTPRARWGTGIALALTASVLTAGTAASSSAPTPTATAAPMVATATVVAPNPLAHRRWGVYKGGTEQSWQPYVDSSGANRALLAKIALRPKAAWFGRWTSDADIASKVRAYVANANGGDPNVLVQMTVFRMVPWEHDACNRLPTLAEQTSYRQWIRQFAAGIGSAHAAVILQPDGPFALCAPGGSRLPSHLIGYAARSFTSLPNTSVYIDAGASDWPAGKPVEAAKILSPAGIRYARGFALNSTHYASTSSNIEFGTQLVRELAAEGFPGKRFVINTSSNGQPFTFGNAPGPNPDNATTCSTLRQTGCVTLGIPPTNDRANPRWGLSARNEFRARTYVDGYLWFGRPWLTNQSSPFDMPRALAIARTTPY